MAENYKKYTQIEHVLERPGMYVGDISDVSSECWIINQETNTACIKTCRWNPGIFKIFDEILTNASDERQRNINMRHGEVDFFKTQLARFFCGC